MVVFAIVVGLDHHCWALELPSPHRGHLRVNQLFGATPQDSRRWGRCRWCGGVLCDGEGGSFHVLVAGASSSLMSFRRFRADDFSSHSTPSFSFVYLCSCRGTGHLPCKRSMHIRVHALFGRACAGVPCAEGVSAVTPFVVFCGGVWGTAHMLA